jgi:hypothetical protein
MYLQLAWELCVCLSLIPPLYLIHITTIEMSGIQAGSEHTIDGDAYPMELQLVHYNVMYSSFDAALASNEREALAIVSVFYKVYQRSQPTVLCKILLGSHTHTRT